MSRTIFHFDLGLGRYPPEKFFTTTKIIFLVEPFNMAVSMYYTPENCFRATRDILGHVGPFWAILLILGNFGPFWCCFETFGVPVGT